MKNFFAEKNLTTKQVVVGIWIVFSVLYIAQDMWRDGLQTSYQLGQEAGARVTINQTILEAQKGCEPFAIYNELGQVNLINMACLQAPAEESTEAVTQ